MCVGPFNPVILAKKVGDITVLFYFTLQIPYYVPIPISLRLLQRLSVNIGRKFLHFIKRLRVISSYKVFPHRIRLKDTDFSSQNTLNL